MGKCEIKEEGRRLVALLFSLAAIQVAAYYLATATVGAAGLFSIAQPDTLLFCQAARRICEGHAFSFSAGAAVSTGTTSVAYPFVLAIPYAFGFVGDRLFLAGFLLNAVFYFLFLFGWAAAFRRWLPERAVWLSCILLALCPMPAYAALAQSDTGLWMAVSGLFAASLARRKGLFCFLLLAVAPWVRPEGVLLIGALAFVSLCRREWRWFLLACLAGCSVLGVFALNYHLTGSISFSSVANKGLCVGKPLAEAVPAVFEQVVRLVREIVLSLTSDLPRALYSVPYLGGVALLLGITVFAWRREGVAGFSVLLLAAAGSIVIVAQSGWQGTNMDRYLAWLMPLVLFFSAVGWQVASEWLRAHFDGRLLLAVPVGYLAIASVATWCIFHLSCREHGQLLGFADDIERFLPTGASLGTAGNCGVAYRLSDRRVVNLAGIYSPELQSKDIVGALEILKNEPTTRYDYWLLKSDDPVPSAISRLMQEIVLTGPQGLQVRRCDWTAFDRARTSAAISNRTVKAFVDVCYEKAERCAALEVLSHYGTEPSEPIVRVGDLGGETIVDCGRLIWGDAEVTVGDLEPGKDLWVTVRTCDEVEVGTRSPLGVRSRTQYGFQGELGVHLAVDGEECACCHTHIGKKGFSDVTFRLPGKFITGNRHRIGIFGDHVAFAYWFCQ